MSWTYVISDLNGEEIVGSFYEKELQKTKLKNDHVTNAALDARHKDLVQQTTFESELKTVSAK